MRLRRASLSLSLRLAFATFRRCQSAGKDLGADLYNCLPLRGGQRSSHSQGEWLVRSPLFPHFFVASFTVFRLAASKSLGFRGCLLTLFFFFFF